jgi:hypothetical protein
MADVHSGRERRDRAHEIRSQEQRQAQREPRRDRFAEDLALLAADFAGNPEQLALWLAEREEHGSLRPADAQRAWTLLSGWCGADFADRALDLASERARRGGAAVKDDDLGRAAGTRRLVAELAPRLGLRPEDVDVRMDEDACARAGAIGTSGLMQDGRIFLRPTAFDPQEAQGRELLAHELTHVAQREAGKGGRPLAPASAAEVEAHGLATRLAAGQGVAAVQYGLPLERLAAHGGATAPDLANLSEKELKALVFVQSGPNRGKPTWQDENQPNVSPPPCTYEEFEKAAARLDQLAAQHSGPSVTEQKKTTIRRNGKEVTLNPSLEEWSRGTATQESLEARRKADARVHVAQERVADSKGKKHLKSAKKKLAEASKDRDRVREDTRDDVAKNDDAVDAARDAEHKKKSRAGRFLDEVSMKGDLAVTGGQVSKAVHEDRQEGVAGPAGSTRDSSVTVLGVGAQYKGAVSVGESGVTVEGSAGASATLVSFSEQVKWQFPFTVMGEAVNANVYVKAEGMAGAEAKAHVKANLQRAKPNGLKVDENAVQAGVSAFAGAKVGVSAGAGLEWQKKSQKTYEPKMAQSGKAVVDLVSMASPPLGWCLRRLGADAAAAKVLGLLFEWGQEGNVPLLAASAGVEGSAGIGGTARAGISLRGGKLKTYAQAKATLGLGLGGTTEIVLDVVEGPKFALIVMGQLREVAEKYIKEATAKGIQFASDTWDQISGWWGSDDRAREAVANGAHKVMPPGHSRKLADDMLGWWCSEEDQAAIVRLLTDLKSMGKLGSMSGDEGFKSKALSKLSGQYHRQAAGLLGASPWK